MPAGADLVFTDGQGVLKLPKEYFTGAGVREAAPGNFFIFKGFLLQSEAY